MLSFFKKFKKQQTQAKEIPIKSFMLVTQTSAHTALDVMSYLNGHYDKAIAKSFKGDRILNSDYPIYGSLPELIENHKNMSPSGLISESVYIFELGVDKWTAIQEYIEKENFHACVVQARNYFDVLIEQSKKGSKNKKACKVPTIKNKHYLLNETVLEDCSVSSVSQDNTI